MAQQKLNHLNTNRQQITQNYVVSKDATIIIADRSTLMTPAGFPGCPSCSGHSSCPRWVPDVSVAPVFTILCTGCPCCPGCPDCSSRPGCPDTLSRLSGRFSRSCLLSRLFLFSRSSPSPGLSRLSRSSQLCMFIDHDVFFQYK